MSKNEVEKIKELARMYYLNGDTQKLVAEKVGKSRVTINKWVAEGGLGCYESCKNYHPKGDCY